VIKNAVIHLLNEQPVIADLYQMPQSLDQGLLCTNLRTMDGKRPVFVERSEGVFYFPYIHVRFLEIPPASTAMAGIETPASEADAAALEAAAVTAAEAAEADKDLELDEDFLRRIRDV
jgi:hypothetical protein